VTFRATKKLRRGKKTYLSLKVTSFRDKWCWWHLRRNMSFRVFFVNKNLNSRKKCKLYSVIRCSSPGLGSGRIWGSGPFLCRIRMVSGRLLVYLATKNLWILIMVYTWCCFALNPEIEVPDDFYLDREATSEIFWTWIRSRTRILANTQVLYQFLQQKIYNQSWPVGNVCIRK
jgi:hypothetical protein